MFFWMKNVEKNLIILMEERRKDKIISDILTSFSGKFFFFLLKIQIIFGEVCQMKDFHHQEKSRLKYLNF